MLKNKIIASLWILAISLTSFNITSADIKINDDKDSFVIMKEVKEISNNNFFSRFFRSANNNLTKIKTYYSIRFQKTWESKIFNWYDICFKSNPLAKHWWTELNSKLRLNVTLIKDIDWGIDKNMWSQYFISNYGNQELRWNNVWPWKYYFVYSKNNDYIDIYDDDALIYNCDK